MDNDDRSPSDAPRGDALSLPSGVRSPDAKLVCLYLAQVEEARPDEIKATLGMDLLTVYSLLDGLTERDLVERERERYRLRGGS